MVSGITHTRQAQYALLAAPGIGVGPGAGTVRCFPSRSSVTPGLFRKDIVQEAPNPPLSDRARPANGSDRGKYELTLVVAPDDDGVQPAYNPGQGRPRGGRRPVRLPRRTASDDRAAIDHMEGL
ncbi:MAG: hypothetical protein AMXMBFR6_19540 [Betaproteobacteria bacterium]